MAATIQGEIRIGPNHQARVPPLVNASCDEPTRETLVWRPDRLPDTDLLMFLRAARSMAAFAGMCDGGSSEDGFLAASRDQTTATAMEALHQNAYDTGRALHDLVKKPIGHTIEKTWTEDDIKRFVRGLKQHGKNFFRIRRDLLSHKETCDLVEFYYLWKKSPAAVTHRPRQRPRRGQMLRRGKTGNAKTPRATPSENSSTSDSDSGCEDSDDNSNLSGPCRHCEVSVAKEWHRVDKEGTVLCTDCKLHFDEARNDVIRANDPQVAIENKPPMLAAESAEQVAPPAKRSKLEVLSPTSLAPPPPLIPANVSPTGPTSTAPTLRNLTDQPTLLSQSVCTTLPQSFPNIRSPSTTSVATTIDQPALLVIKDELHVKDESGRQQEKDDENGDSEANATAQDDVANLLTATGNKGLDPKIDDTECHRSANAIFRRHWNRGDNSCARTDLIYVPIPRISANAVIRSHHEQPNAIKEKSDSRMSGMSDTRRTITNNIGAGQAAGTSGSLLDSSMPALQRLHDYALAASGALGSTSQTEMADSRFKSGIDSRSSPSVMPPPPLQYTTPAPTVMQRPLAPMASAMPPYELFASQQQFDALTAERWLAAEQQRMQWERLVAMNPAASNDMAIRLQLERMMAGPMHLTHTHAHTHLHIHAARAAAAMHQNPLLAGMSPWAAAAGRPGAMLDPFNPTNMLYGGPTAPPAFPPPGFLPPHGLDSLTADRIAQQQHILDILYQRQMMQDRD